MKTDRTFVNVMLRFDPAIAEELRKLAFQARLPLAVYVRELALGRVPTAAPPTPEALLSNSPSVAELVRIAHATVSNLSQVAAHATRLGAPLDRLAKPGEAIDLIAARTKALGLQAKAGGVDEGGARVLLGAVGPAYQALNEQLVRPLNQGKQPSILTWQEVLGDLLKLLPKAAEVKE